jgi:hypothetical protein
VTVVEQQPWNVQSGALEGFLFGRGATLQRCYRALKRTPNR